jgi:non-ribosomal peptide synthetase component F
MISSTALPSDDAPRQDKAPYPRWQIEALIWGEYEDPTTGELTYAEDFTWSRLRSQLEHHGVLEGSVAGLVFDVERALMALYRRHPEAATAVIAQMFFEPSHPSDLTQIFGTRSRPASWIAKAQAWLEAYLNGAPISAPKGTYSCEVAYRRAR